MRTPKSSFLKWLVRLTHGAVPVDGIQSDPKEAPHGLRNPAAATRPEPPQPAATHVDPPEYAENRRIHVRTMSLRMQWKKGR